MPIHNREDFHALAAFREPDRLAPALRGGKRGINEALAFINGPFVAQRIGQLGEDLAQHLSLTPLWKPAMDGFVVGITLGQQVPLRAGVQNPEHGLQDRSGRHGFAAGATVRDVFLRKMFSDACPLVIAQAEHDRTYRDECSGRQLF